MLFAVIDIETTGGYAASNGITEIAVIITNGYQVCDSFYALLNPMVPIPRFVEMLTGITNEKVKDQPPFSSISEELFNILHDKIFVAHNVNFDYSFVKHHLGGCGFQLETKKLCTIRLGRKMMPGLKGYGLDKICNHLKINIEGRHSALGDASATVELLHYLISIKAMPEIEIMLKGKSKDTFLPPNLSESSISKLPPAPGVYYFHEKGGKIIYVGKAKNIKKRVTSHFSNNKPNRQKQDFLKKIYHVSYQPTATELMALVLEGVEIKNRWPEQNRSQKHFEQLYGLYTYEDGKGFKWLFIEKNKKQLQPFYTFNLLAEGYSLLKKLVKEFELCPQLCFLTKPNADCRLDDYECPGACCDKESADVYNKKVENCIQRLNEQLPTFAVLDKGLEPENQSCILIEKGKFTAMGYVSRTDDLQLAGLKSSLTVYADNQYVRGMIYKYAEAHPYQMLSF